MESGFISVDDNKGKESNMDLSVNFESVNGNKILLEQSNQSRNHEKSENNLIQDNILSKTEDGNSSLPQIVAHESLNNKSHSSNGIVPNNESDGEALFENTQSQQSILITPVA